ncbi:HNH endonuclease [Xenorhabdus sp. PB61.4]|uniref:HNH endonuclease n=1 Tax=Xenorhabdus sp. PB61.4 TaxID=2788940 RepID=UPI001E478640|nr:HNH endonuclease [Xenorhabdus sp. PB61.4]MCC8367082.1 HNH endonuclease [Xenorhabdus sp. PB61.4]
MNSISHSELLSRYFYDPQIGIFYKRRGNGSIGKSVGYYGKKYATLNVSGKSYLVHRLAWLYVHGTMPKHDIDHINGDTKDNRIENLREATRQQNSWNRSIATNNTSGYKGVSQCRQTQKWKAQIKHNNKIIVIGVYDSPEKASRDYESNAIRFRKEFHKDTTTPKFLIPKPDPWYQVEPKRLVEKTKRRMRRSQKSIECTAIFILSI